MSKPLRNVGIRTADDKTGQAEAVFDTGSFYTLLREDKVPSGAMIIRRPTPLVFRAASVGSSLTVSGDLTLVMTLDGKEFDDAVLVSPDLAQEMLIGAGTMQKWDISILNRNGSTEVRVGRDRRDPAITEVDECRGQA